MLRALSSNTPYSTSGPQIGTRDLGTYAREAIDRSPWLINAITNGSIASGLPGEVGNMYAFPGVSILDRSLSCFSPADDLNALALPNAMQSHFPMTKKGQITPLGRLHDPHMTLSPLTKSGAKRNTYGRGALCTVWSLDYKERPADVLVMIYIWTVPGQNDEEFKEVFAAKMEQNALTEQSSWATATKTMDNSAVEMTASPHARTIVIVKAQSPKKQIVRTVMERVQNAIRSIEHKTPAKPVPLAHIILKPILPASQRVGTTYPVVFEVSR